MDIVEKRSKADAGSCVAQSRLGLSYLYGYQVAVNYQEAFKYISAAQGGPRATLNLGLMYAKGLGIYLDLIANIGQTSLNHFSAKFVAKGRNSAL